MRNVVFQVVLYDSVDVDVSFRLEEAGIFKVDAHLGAERWAHWNIVWLKWYIRFVLLFALSFWFRRRRCCCCTRGVRPVVFL